MLCEKIRPVGTVALFVIWLVSAALAADRPVTDLDKRAAATLYSAYAHREMKWESTTTKNLEGLNQWDVDAAAKKARYGLQFGGVDSFGVDTRGVMRVTVGDQLADTSKGGWIPLPVDKATGAEVFYKTVKQSAADKFNDVAARRKFGNIIVSVSQRRPLTESTDASATIVLQRFSELVDYGRKTGLIRGERVVLTLLSPSQEVQLGDEPLALGLKDSGDSRQSIRVEVKDAEDKPVGTIEQYTFELLGPVADLAQLEIDGKKVDVPGKKYVYKDPPQLLDVVLILPQRSATVDQKLYEQATPATPGATVPDPGVGLKVAAKLR